jgi:mannose-6-phosphate isomerase-like protein (cupin superfamily)
VTGVSSFSVQAGEGRTLPTPTADVVTIKADTRQTNGSMTVMELRVAPGSGPATHTHLREDELWWVLEGDFRFKVGSDWLRASTGGMAFGPRGMTHAFQNAGATPGRLLIVTTPSGLSGSSSSSSSSGPWWGISSSSPPSVQRTGSSSRVRR